ncbi:hypothetical protein A8990_13069 [Paenibacillus taihuensis]|uniref:Photosynthesis system II assembly factor YCF48-like protein n=1 Tax=Paenibacillus taihuensis TaxID=1156355 RepID=A0A3D9R3D4_9BACL|nr:hypothetical protein [Paenibacillus taihuensis]REE70514.1 hypothetical protein A8990_13069 [Paenibacillus taihuensis]
MKKRCIALIVTITLLSGCTNKEVTSPSTSAMRSSESNPTTNQGTATGDSPDQSTTISENKKDATTFSSNTSEEEFSISNVPIRKDWEKHVNNESTFTSSVTSNSKFRWLLLTSEPALGQMGKTLYKSEDYGKSWVFVNDVSQTVEGYVTGLTFRDDKNGWISATQHGTELLPLYRTINGGESWKTQKIDIPEGYKYGNAFPPIFDEKDPMQGTLKIEFVGDLNTKTMKFITTDGGETWRP